MRPNLLQFADDAVEAPVAVAHVRAPIGAAAPFSVMDLVVAVWRRRLLVVGCSLIALGLGVAASVGLEPSFTAAAQIVVDPVELNLVQNELTPRQPSADAGVSITETQAHVIASDSVLQRVVASLRLDEDRDFYKHAFWRDGGVLEDTMLLLGAAAPGSDDPRLVALETLRKAIVVRRTERTYVIDIAVKSRDAAKAALIANTICDAYLVEKSAARFDMARRAAGELEDRLEALRTAVRLAEDAAIRFREQNNLVMAGGRLSADQQISELTAQLSVAQSRTSEARVRLAQAAGAGRGRADAALPEIVQSADVRALRQQRADLARNQAELGARLGPRHPAIIQLSAQVASLDRSIAAAIGRVVAVNRDDYDRDVAAEAALGQAVAQLKTKLVQNEQAQVSLRELDRDADSRRAVYDLFLRRARETGEQERLDTSNARVITAAVPPRKRSFPPSPLLLLPGSLVLGLLLGAGLAIVLGPPNAIRRRPAAGPIWAQGD